MSSINFNGAYIRYADLRFKDKAGVFAVIHMTAELTDDVIKAMEWEAPPDCADMIKLSGGLNGRVMTLTPDQASMKSQSLSMELTGVDDFKYFRVPGSDDEAEHGELRFQARTSEVNAVGKVEAYLRVVGQGTGTMAVSFEKQDKLDLGGTEAAAEPPPAPAPKKGKKGGMELVQ